MFEHTQAWEGDELKLSPVGWLPLPSTQAERMVAALATREPHATIFLRPPGAIMGGQAFKWTQTCSKFFPDKQVWVHMHRSLPGRPWVAVRRWAAGQRVFLLHIGQDGADGTLLVQYVTLSGTSFCEVRIPPGERLTGMHLRRLVQQELGNAFWGPLRDTPVQLVASAHLQIVDDEFVLNDPPVVRRVFGKQNLLSPWLRQAFHPPVR